MLKNKYLTIFGISLLLVSMGLILSSTYVPPAINQINITLCNSYVPPAINQINITLRTDSDCISDSCTYSGSGDWFIESSDYCNLTTNTISPVLTNILIFNGTGRTTITGNISNFSIYKLQNNAIVQCKDGGCIKY